MNAPQKIWARRILAIAMDSAAFAMLAPALPVLLGLTAAFDRARGRSWLITRALLFFVWYLACELAGVAAGAAIRVTGRAWAGGDQQRFLRWNHALVRWWVRMLGRGALRIFRIRLESHDGGICFGRAPVLVFVRHASVADTVLALLLISVPHRIRLRCVLKRELLRNPFVDIVGNRLPNVFLARDTMNTREVAAVAALASDLGPADGVLIYPEGARFSVTRRYRIAERLREKGRGADAREAASLWHVLPPSSAGALALLEAAPHADVIFLAHTGLEGLASFHRYVHGGLEGRTVHAQLRAVKAADIPAGREARRAWLMDQWHQVDEFIDNHQIGRRKRHCSHPRPLRLVHGTRRASQSGGGSGAPG